jgi:GT2 family glycosyltransferase
MSTDDLPAVWPSISVIVPVYNDPAGIRRCLAAIKNQAYPGNCQIIVIDNAMPFSLEALAAGEPDVLFLSEPKPGSYNARNTGLSRATGEILAFTDADCQPLPNWLISGIRRLNADPQLGMVGGAINIVIDHDRPPSLPELFETVMAFPQETYIKNERYAATANMFVYRSVAQKVGGFDGTLKSGGDFDFGRRVSDAGYRLDFVPDAIVNHPARATYKQMFGKARRVAGGARDRKPGWRNCLRFCYFNLFPSRRRLARIVHHRQPAIDAVTKVRLIVLAILINWTYAYVRLMLQVTGGQSSRA